MKSDLTYVFDGQQGKLLRCSDVDRDGTFEMFYARMQQYGGIAPDDVVAAAPAFPRLAPYAARRLLMR